MGSAAREGVSPLCARTFFMALELTSRGWALSEFGECELGDPRRTARAVTYATAAAERPEGPTPRQTDDWGDCKAAYRLFHRPEVTFAALAGPHWRRTRAAAQGHVLVVNDTTETDYRGPVEGLGPTGNGRGRGFLLHSSLMLRAADLSIVGLAGQELFYRKPAPPGESNATRKARPRESQVWNRVVELVGAPAVGVRYTHLMDRAADNWELFRTLRAQDCDWVVRASATNRKVRVGAEDARLVTLEEALAGGAELGTYEFEVRAATNRPARRARIGVRVVAVATPVPSHTSRAAREAGAEPIAHTVVEARELRPPPGATPIRWILYTSHAVSTFAEAEQVLGWYEARWTIEEFHKGLKTGCRLEERRYESAGALEAVAGLYSVLAVRLLQLKTVARAEPERPAAALVPAAWLEFLRLLRPKAQLDTVRQVVRELAKLGGFLARKHDGEPGWQTLWHGIEKFQLLLQGAQLARNTCG